MERTKFETDLKAYFPDIFTLHEIGKEEPYLWDLVTLLIEMKTQGLTGFIRINYSKGNIDAIQKLVDALAFKKRNRLTENKL